MPTTIHFIDVGQGNMVLIQAADGKVFVFDCNITVENEYRVLSYISQQIGRSPIHAFICSHRDCDHIRGIKKLHSRFPIARIWDSDYPGTTTTADEYKEYMELRRQLPVTVIKRKTRDDFGRSRFRYMSAQDERLLDDANAQGIVLKIEQLDAASGRLSSVMLPGDSDARTWKEGIFKDYNKTEVASSILMASHHGSISFFDDPSDTQHYYTEHMRAINPAMTVISVGPNQHGHPDGTALELYEKYSTGSNQGNKVFRTDRKGTMQLMLKDEGGWSLDVKKLAA
jgi:beta-lactamase superfamily II metal-dependent hydrolase